MFYVHFNKCNRFGNNLDNLLSRFLIPFFSSSFVFFSFFPHSARCFSTHPAFCQCSCFAFGITSQNCQQPVDVWLFLPVHGAVTRFFFYVLPFLRLVNWLAVGCNFKCRVCFKRHAKMWCVVLFSLACCHFFFSFCPSGYIMCVFIGWRTADLFDGLQIKRQAGSYLSLEFAGIEKNAHQRRKYWP